MPDPDSADRTAWSREDIARVFGVELSLKYDTDQSHDAELRVWLEGGEAPGPTQKYDSNQPRYPKGHPLGGHFAPAGGTKAQVSVTPDAYGTYKVVADGKPVGEVSMPENGHDYSAETWVNYDIRRQGIMSRAYDLVGEQRGRSLVPNPWGLTEDGVQFWKNRLGRMAPAKARETLDRSLAYADNPSSLAYATRVLEPLLDTLSVKFDPNQPRHPKGHPLGGHFAPSGGAAGVTQSSAPDLKSGLKELGDDVDGYQFAGRTTTDAAVATYLSLFKDPNGPHPAARDNVSSVDLYQGSYYAMMNAAMRHRSEYENFQMMLYDLDEEGDADAPDWRTDSSLLDNAWRDSGMADATGKDHTYWGVSGDDYLGADMLADSMEADMYNHAPKLPKGFVMYRTFRNADLLNNPQDYIGADFTEGGFASMTYNPIFATAWGSGGNRRALLRVTTSDDSTQGLALQRTRYGGDPDPYEFEVLLPPGATFRITGITEVADGDLLVHASI